MAKDQAEPARDSEEAPKTKPFKGPVSIEQRYQVDGRKVTVKVQFPAAVADEVGMENLVAAANRAIITLESKDHEISKIRGSR